MWPLIRAELEYHRRVLLSVVFVAMPIMAVVMIYMTQGTNLTAGYRHFMPVAAAFMLTGHMLQARESERRDRQLVLLPLTTRKLAFVRLVVGTAPSIAAVVVYASVSILLSEDTQAIVLLQLTVALALFLRCIECVILDLYCAVPQARLHGRFAVGATFTAIMVLGAYVHVTRGQPHPTLARIFTAPYDLARMSYGPTCLLLASIVVALLSLVTFSRRRSYLQK
ncbi:MAG: hypothetical protein HOM68_14285 [Gemmatimonadetes bacterium]|jgi:hypothetical protein|nr:hypothetical protein [Gemmatimonadota bacterium]MBT4610769.1 hypothetical protein [Gemmatimonadota bacterium]MBT5057708.1 hypothetical protein [Gemmatimonadota bacterium]MBT5141380.1 hypothetical protein [Gemmatimonadota bacterium]MBT5590461.1 hypothetical protein [Gemmatimonadota bacterium]